MKNILLLLFAFCGATNAADVPFVSGGVGLENREEMRALEPSYNLRLVFASATGEYLAGVGVVIRTTEGNTVLRTVSEGPWLYVKLAPGTYTVSAEQDGASITKRIVVGGRRSTLHFSWT
jgi:hypothetical protein